MLGAVGLAFTALGADPTAPGAPAAGTTAPDTTAPGGGVFEHDGLAHAVAVLRCWDLTLRGADRARALELAESEAPGQAAAVESIVLCNYCLDI
ncbi:hypothetical protein ACFWXO_44200 [Kitasatospora sp. NPDC059088]|uniref:hypothetical protein n=1 Tax=Kitasatospora sp. NPDC059088 TaxID=3346722 RepID=UPI0036C1408B